MESSDRFVKFDRCPPSLEQLRVFGRRAKHVLVLVQFCFTFCKDSRPIRARHGGNMKPSDAQHILRKADDLREYAERLNGDLTEKFQAGPEPIGLCSTLGDVDIINDNLGIQTLRGPHRTPIRNHFAGKPIRVGELTHWVYSQREWDQL